MGSKNFMNSKPRLDDERSSWTLSHTRPKDKMMLSITLWTGEIVSGFSQFSAANSTLKYQKVRQLVPIVMSFSHPSCMQQQTRMQKKWGQPSNNLHNRQERNNSAPQETKGKNDTRHTGSSWTVQSSTKYMFSPKFLLLNHWTTKPLPISLISSSCIMYVPSHQLHLPAVWLLHLPCAHLKSSGQCAFFHQAPFLQNYLPYSLQHSSSIASFKSTHNTHLLNSKHWREFWSYMALPLCVCVCVCGGTDGKDVESTKCICL